MTDKATPAGAESAGGAVADSYGDESLKWYQNRRESTPLPLTCDRASCGCRQRYDACAAAEWVLAHPRQAVGYA